jgi:hypothetical protein
MPRILLNRPCSLLVKKLENNEYPKLAEGVQVFVQTPEADEIHEW